MIKKYKGQNVLTSEVLLETHLHIRCNLTKTSYYTGTVIKYLNKRRTIWKFYNEKRSENTVGCTIFYQYFKKIFNPRFGQSQVDCYCECNTLNIIRKNSRISETVMRNSEADLMIHKRRSQHFILY